MTKTIQFTLTAQQMAHVLAWRARVEADTGRPVTGVMLSFECHGPASALAWGDL